MRNEHIMRNIVMPTIFLCCTSVAGCNDSYTPDNARALFSEKTAAFHRMETIISSHPEFESVSPAFDPVIDTRLISKFARFDSNSIEAYQMLVRILKAVGVERIRIFKSLDRKRNKIYMQNYLVRSWGFLRSGSGISIVFFKGGFSPQSFFNSGHCANLSESHWFVCEFS